MATNVDDIEIQQTDTGAGDETVPTLYDKIPYESRPYPRAHVDRMATVATLMGMSPSPIGASRVLEIGCAAGGNLIPMALSLPGSQFIGIDLSARELADGQAVVSELGLKNIRLLHKGIEAVGTSLGQFDYIICHGVFSWVPATARQGILDICRSCLTPQGVAYISYNTYPGWHFRDLVRHMMRFHARAETEPLARSREGRRLVEFLARTLGSSNAAYAAVLKQESDLIARVADWYLCHDHMAEINDPFYFHQFAEMAAAGDLQYLGEAEFGAMLPRGLSPETIAALGRLSSDMIAQQQYLDFVRATPFRHSLLCRKDVSLDRQPNSNRLEGLHVAAQAKAQPAAIDLRSTDPVTFIGPGGKLTTNRPLMKAAMLHLMEQWPRTIAFPALCSAAGSRLDPSPMRSAEQLRADRALLGGILLKGYYASNLLEFHAGPLECCVAPGERPVASPLARLQAEKSAVATNLRHDSVALSEVQRQVLRRLDGRHDRAALAQMLTELAKQGTLVVQDATGAGAAAAVGRALDTALAEMARHALLIA